MKQLQKKIKSGKLDVNEDDPFELFIASTNIRYAYYHETHKILGSIKHYYFYLFFYLVS